MGRGKSPYALSRCWRGSVEPVTRHARPLAVLAVSSGTLAYEVLLVRAFAIEQFHHFAYLAVGVAMLGVGASGTVFALVRGRRVINADHWLAGAALATSLALLGTPLAADLVPVDPTRLAWDAGQWVRLGVLQAMLAVPFLFGGLATLSALAGADHRLGLLYGASFAGSGLGAAAGVAVLGVLDPARALALPALLAAPAVWWVAPLVSRSRWWRAAAAVLVAGAVAGATWPPWRLELLPYKGLAQVRAFPGARVMAERSSPTGWIVAVEAPAFRFAPGLSLAYPGAFPAQRALFVDGELAGAVSQWSAESRALLDWQPSALPYALAPRQRVLVLGPAGGHEVAGAVAHGADDVTAVTLHSGIAALAGVPDPATIGGHPGSRVRWVVGDARSALARARERYDLITLGPLAGGAPGASPVAVGEDFHHTEEAYRLYLERLAPGGVLAITDWLAVPPRGEVRTILTVGAALRQGAPERARDGLLVVRSWGTVTTVAKPDGFTPAEVDAVAAWVAERRFDVDWRPGLSAPATRFNFLERPVPFEAARAAAAGADEARRFAARYPFDVQPATDARPYPHAFIGRRTIAMLAERGRGDWLPFAEWGYVAMLATLAQSAALAAVLLLLPALFARRHGREGRAPLLAYFGAIGLGYLFAEIAAIQQLTLLLGHPVYAVGAVLAALLVGSGAGSAWSDRLAPGRAVAVTLGVALACGALAGGLLPLVHSAQAWGLGARGVAALVLLGPLAVAMGLPFPLGLRRVAAGPEGGVAWAWAANGFASVVAAPLAALIGLEVGSRALFLGAGAAYALAGAVQLLASPRPAASSIPG